MKERMIKTRTKITTFEEVTDTRHNQNEGVRRFIVHDSYIQRTIAEEEVTPMNILKDRRKKSRVLDHLTALSQRYDPDGYFG